MVRSAVHRSTGQRQRNIVQHSTAQHSVAKRQCNTVQHSAHLTQELRLRQARLGLGHRAPQRRTHRRGDLPAQRAVDVLCQGRGTALCGLAALACTRSRHAAVLAGRRGGSLLESKATLRLPPPPEWRACRSTTHPASGRLLHLAARAHHPPTRPSGRTWLLRWRQVDPGGDLEGHSPQRLVAQRPGCCRQLEPGSHSRLYRVSQILNAGGTQCCQQPVTITARCAGSLLRHAEACQLCGELGVGVSGMRGRRCGGSARLDEPQALGDLRMADVEVEVPAKLQGSGRITVTVRVRVKVADVEAEGLPGCKGSGRSG